MTEDGAVEIGDKLAGRYAVEQKLGAGTMAYVVKAHDTFTGEKVSCKLPLDRSPYKTAALIAQYQFLRKIRSPHLQTLFALERQVEPSGFFEFLVFEFVDGENLETWRPGRPLRERLQVLGAIAETLGLLSAEGGVHGDLWAPNVVVQSPGRVVLIDPDASWDSALQTGSRALIAQQDLSGLKSIAEELVSVGERDVLSSVFQRFERGAGTVTPNEVAASVRYALSLPFLPGERDLLTLADGYKRKVDEDRDTFVMLCRMRDAAFVGARSMLQRVTAAFGITIRDQMVASEELLEKEIAAAAEPRPAMLQPRVVTAVSVEGDQLNFWFQGKSDIRKPWPHPERPGLIDTGWMTVLRNGQAVITVSVELWLRERSPLLLVREASKYRHLDNTVIERAIRILIEQLIPGVDRPVEPANKSPSWSWRLAGEVETVNAWCKSKKRRPPTWKDSKQWRAAFVEMVISGGGRLRSTGRHYSSRLRDFFKAVPTYPARLDLVRMAAAEFVADFGDEFHPLYRFDIQVIDERDGLIKVTFEGGDTSHVFEMDAATVEMVVARRKRERAATSKQESSGDVVIPDEWESLSKALQTVTKPRRRTKARKSST